MATDEEVPEDRELMQIAQDLIATGKLHPLVALLKGADGGPEHARDALRLLGEYDLDVLVQVALDTLIDEHFDDPESARQTRRVIHDEP